MTAAAGPARILGLDPGSMRTGWALIESHPTRPKLLASGVISLGRLSFHERLGRLREALDEILAEIEVETAAVEAPFHGVSARSALQLAHARGVILAGLAGARLEVAEYAPAAVKRSVVGHGRADKDQVRTMVLRQLGGERPTTRYEDETDAIAVALCHAAHLPSLRIAEASRR